MFKKIIYIYFLLQFLIPVLSAAPIDQFECNIEHAGNESYLPFSTTFPLNILREKIPTDQNYSLTKGQASHRVKLTSTDQSSFLDIKFNLRYLQAFRPKANHASIHRCISAKIKTPHWGEDIDCIEASSDPFDFAHGTWSRTGLYRGQPSFNARTFKLILGYDREITFRCKHVETLLNSSSYIHSARL